VWGVRVSVCAAGAQPRREGPPPALLTATRNLNSDGLLPLTHSPTNITTVLPSLPPLPLVRLLLLLLLLSVLLLLFPLCCCCWCPLLDSGQAAFRQRSVTASSATSTTAHTQLTPAAATPCAALTAAVARGQPYTRACDVRARALARAAYACVVTGHVTAHARARAATKYNSTTPPPPVPPQRCPSLHPHVYTHTQPPVHHPLAAARTRCVCARASVRVSCHVGAVGVHFAPSSPPSLTRSTIHHCPTYTRTQAFTHPRAPRHQRTLTTSATPPPAGALPALPSPPPPPPRDSAARSESRPPPLPSPTTSLLP